MSRWLSSIALVIITSFFLFPFEFTFLPGVNTKMALAALGVCMFGFNHLKEGRQSIKKEEIELLVLASLVSVVSFLSAVINNTHDMTYAGYIISMLVWVFGAYAVIELIRLIQGDVNITTASRYLVAVCVFQCVIALVIDNSPAFKDLVNRYVAGMGFIDMQRLDGTERLYGIGCSLDVAGTRFAAVLVILSQLLLYTKKDDTLTRYLYILAFFVIVLVGDMISRTTILGAALAVLLFVLHMNQRTSQQSKKRSIITNFLSIGLAVVAISVVLYNTNPVFHRNVRFAFEGFFSLAEKGRWETNSNTILKNMVVFPESLKTWIIGDAYMVNPHSSDPYYVGQFYHGFYKNTDIGYLRFVFYFGIVGLLVFSWFFVAVCRQLMKRFPHFKLAFILITLLNFIIWFKVSTDIFLILAFYLCVPKEEPEQLASA